MYSYVLPGKHYVGFDLVVPRLPLLLYCTQEMLCIAYFTKVSSDEEACSELAELGLSRYLIRVLPERRLSLHNRWPLQERRQY